eukprot:INCI18056.4.p1 GENE.INCI18056.4~~INCI18056.4.p1  ORF type:complete len:393 (+),score=42.50 INCI18056.4:100-1278(+)
MARSAFQAAARAATVAIVAVCALLAGTVSSRVVFGPPTSTGHSNASRVDPFLLAFASTTGSADQSHMLVTGAVDGHETFVQSRDGGSSWTAAAASVGVFGDGFLYGVDCSSEGNRSGGQQCTVGSVFGVPQGYLTNTSDFTGPWNSTQRVEYSVMAKGTVNAFVDNQSQPAMWAATPHPVGLLAFDSGGMAHVGGDTYIASAWVWYATDPIVEPGRVCCNGSVVTWLTEDGGNSWQWRGEVASKQSINAAARAGAGWAVSEEGPNENDIVLLRDGKTLFCVMRLDGGDGVPSHAHVPYVFATSVDLGLTWTIKEAPAFMLSARPRALVLPNGALVVAGGRPALSLWVSEDGFGDLWEQFDIPSEHNARSNSTEVLKSRMLSHWVIVRTAWRF